WSGIDSDSDFGELGGSVFLHEAGMRGSKRIDDRVILVGQDAAGRIDEAAAGFDERRRRGQDSRLLGGQLCDVGRRLAPFEIGVAAQGAESRAWRIDQNAVDLF